MNFRTDLALERHELIRDSVPDGVDFEEEICGSTKITRINIKTEEGSVALNKRCGNYITLEIPKLSVVVSECEKEIELIAKELSALIKTDGTVLVAGLGNHNITPDAIGPKTVEFTLSTRHIKDELVDFNFHSVASLSPGVMGQTGIESGDIISAVAKKIDAKLVIVIDALASMSVDRLGRSIQICDTGISPGSGVNNARKELSKESIGIPVIAVGVPTVVDAVTIANSITKDKVQRSEENSKYSTFMVTPREIDSMVLSISRVLALSIGRALHKSLSISDLYFLSQ